MHRSGFICRHVSISIVTSSYCFLFRCGGVYISCVGFFRDFFTDFSVYLGTSPGHCTFGGDPLSDYGEKPYVISAFADYYNTVTTANISPTYSV